jgi:hypothetical protein
MAECKKPRKLTFHGAGCHEAGKVKVPSSSRISGKVKRSNSTNREIEEVFRGQNADDRHRSPSFPGVSRFHGGCFHRRVVKNEKICYNQSHRKGILDDAGSPKF